MKNERLTLEPGRLYDDIVPREFDDKQLTEMRQAVVSYRAAVSAQPSYINVVIADSLDRLLIFTLAKHVLRKPKSAADLLPVLNEVRDLVVMRIDVDQLSNYAIDVLGAELEGEMAASFWKRVEEIYGDRELTAAETQEQKFDALGDAVLPRSTEWPAEWEERMAQALMDGTVYAERLLSLRRYDVVIWKMAKTRESAVALPFLGKYVAKQVALGETMVADYQSISETLANDSSLLSLGNLDKENILDDVEDLIDRIQERTIDALLWIRYANASQGGAGQVVRQASK